MRGLSLDKQKNKEGYTKAKYYYNQMKEEFKDKPNKDKSVRKAIEMMGCLLEAANE